MVSALAAWVVVLAGSSLIFAVQWERAEPRVSADSYWYLRTTGLLMGQPVGAAQEAAGALTCREWARAHSLGARPAPCLRYRPREVSPRYVAIFDSRPGYPLLLVPFAAAFGLAAGTTVAAGVLFVLVGVLGYLVFTTAGLGRPGAVAAALACGALPVGFYDSRVLAEAAATATTLIVVLGVLRALRGERYGWALAGTGLAATCTVKPGQAVALALALAGGGTVMAVVTAGHRRAGRPVPPVTWRSGLPLLGFGLTAVLLWAVTSTALHLPSLHETSQDLATGHFTRPDDPHPYRALAHRAASLWAHGMPHPLGLPWPIVPALIGAAGVIVRTRVTGFVVTCGCAAAVLLVTAHPLRSEYGRLISHLWIIVAFAVGVLIDLLPRPHRRPLPAGRR